MSAEMDIGSFLLNIPVMSHRNLLVMCLCVLFHTFRVKLVGAATACLATLPKDKQVKGQVRKHWQMAQNVLKEFIFVYIIFSWSITSVVFKLLKGPLHHFSDKHKQRNYNHVEEKFSVSVPSMPVWEVTQLQVYAQYLACTVALTD